MSSRLSRLSSSRKRFASFLAFWPFFVDLGLSLNQEQAYVNSPWDPQVTNGQKKKCSVFVVSTGVQTTENGGTFRTGEIPW